MLPSFNHLPCYIWEKKIPHIFALEPRMRLSIGFMKNVPILEHPVLCYEQRLQITLEITL